MKGAYPVAAYPDDVWRLRELCGGTVLRLMLQARVPMAAPGEEVPQSDGSKSCVEEQVLRLILQAGVAAAQRALGRHRS